MWGNSISDLYSCKWNILLECIIIKKYYVKRAKLPLGKVFFWEITLFWYCNNKLRVKVTNEVCGNSFWTVCHPGCIAGGMLDEVKSYANKQQSHVHERLMWLVVPTCATHGSSAAMFHHSLCLVACNEKFLSYFVKKMWTHFYVFYFFYNNYLSFNRQGTKECETVHKPYKDPGFRLCWKLWSSIYPWVCKSDLLLASVYCKTVHVTSYFWKTTVDNNYYNR